MAKLSGYVEADFLSAGVTSNNNQSNSYTLRQRQAWGQAAFDNGWSVTGGQMWSLVTETKHGVDNRTEALPMTIDPQYTVGFSWARQYGLRVAKNFGNKVWFAVSVENPQATVTSHGNASNFLIGSPGTGGGLYNSAVTACSTSINSTTGAATTTCSAAATTRSIRLLTSLRSSRLSPASDTMRSSACYSRFRDRVFPCEDIAATTRMRHQHDGGSERFRAFNSSKNGGGIGANARWSFDRSTSISDCMLSAAAASAATVPAVSDASVRANGTLDLINSYQGLTTLEWHGPKLDVYFNAGAEYASRAATYDPITGKTVGYGSPLFSNSAASPKPDRERAASCPAALASCTADTRVLIEGTAGVWFKAVRRLQGEGEPRPNTVRSAVLVRDA